MRILRILLLFNLCTLGLCAQNVSFNHDWDIKYLEHDIQFTSNRIAPAPFSTTGEPQAIMIVEATTLDNSTYNDLSKIVTDEVHAIRNELSIDEYLEDDCIAIDNIVSYFDTINSIQIAVIKYRTNGIKGEQKTMPRSTRQILFIYDGKLWISSLIVLFAEDQDNMRSDQMTIIKAIID